MIPHYTIRRSLNSKRFLADVTIVKKGRAKPTLKNVVWSSEDQAKRFDTPKERDAVLDLLKGMGFSAAFGDFALRSDDGRAVLLKGMGFSGRADPSEDQENDGRAVSKADRDRVFARARVVLALDGEKVVVLKDRVAPSSVDDLVAAMARARGFYLTRGPTSLDSIRDLLRRARAAAPLSESTNLLVTAIDKLVDAFADACFSPRRIL